MLPSLLLLVYSSTTFSYSLPTSPVDYVFRVSFDGYLPVLGGVEAQIQVELDLRVSGAGVDGDDQKATTQMTGFRLSMLDPETGKYEALPLSLDNAKEYFPDSVVSFTPFGVVKGTNAPDRQLPIKLPGLHTQHLPEITFLLVEFPASGLEKASTHRYTRKLGDSSIACELTYRGRDEFGESFDIKMTQELLSLEDGYRNPVSEESQAVATVKTVATAKGKVWFSGTKGLIVKSEVIGEAVSEVKYIKGDPSKTRRLVTKYQMERKHE